MYARLKVFAGVACLAAAAFGAQQPPSSSSTIASAGQSLFFGKAGCASCHEVNGRGGITGPELSSAGLQSPDALREKILNPNKTGAAMTVVVKTKDGRDIPA